MGIIRPDPFHEFGYDPLRGMSPATVIDSRHPGTVVPFKRSNVVRPQSFDYGIAVATIVAATPTGPRHIPAPTRRSYDDR